ncbi:MAG TPA: SgcJ/EcaC family oxidoreductase [Bacteroidales bacterium]|nr:SgcJ/EcaC family oxidoreductase [Bacteroidales bacterium]
MKTPLIIIVFLGFSLASFISAFSQDPGKKQVKDIDAIRQTAVNFDSAYNRRDAAAMGAFFLDDGDFQWPTGELLKDRKEIEQYFTHAFRSMPADYQHITTILRIRFLGPDVAIADGTLVIAHKGVREDKKPYYSALLTCVGKKIKGQWKLSAVRLMIPKAE